MGLAIPATSEEPRRLKPGNEPSGNPVARIECKSLLERYYGNMPPAQWASGPRGSAGNRGREVAEQRSVEGREVGKGRLTRLPAWAGGVALTSDRGLGIEEDAMTSIQGLRFHPKCFSGSCG